MTFDQEVREYLEEVERRPRTLEPAGHRHIDASALREHFLARLREPELATHRIKELFREWSPKLARLARYLEVLPQQDAPVDPERAFAFACGVVDQALKRGDAARSLVDRLELTRILDSFVQLDQAEIYALENRLARRDLAHRVEVTRLGRAFLRLRGHDAIRWLLTIEVTQSRGYRDPWRAPRELLERALSSEGVERQPYYDRDDDDGDWEPSSFAFEVATLERLVSLGVAVAYVAGGEVHRYQVDEAMRDVVQRVLDVGPWHAAVTALLEDERAETLPVVSPRATQAIVEQTRLIAHEVRNALIPVRHHLDALLTSSSETHRARVETSRRGVVRVLAFVDDMIATSELVNEPATSFEIGDLIREALSWVDGGERVEIGLPPDPMRIRAPRSRLLRVISNLVLNALQATPAGQRVRIQAGCSQGAFVIRVDDGGPGVPEEHRSIVFRDGFTTRPGGSGFGLAYVRRVVEETLPGKVWCEASDLGGARFVIVLPEGKVER